MIDDDVRRGAGIYSKPVLGFYDLLVIKLSNSFAWRCPSSLMLEQYDTWIATKHLDVGPGTGWFLAHAQLPEDIRITLMDLNENSLASASSRLASVPHDKLVGNVLEEITPQTERFGSIALNYVMHCVPGDWSEKGVAFTHLAARLRPDGVLFGSTILGDSAEHNLGGRALMGFYNRLGIFHNRTDDEAGLRQSLTAAFADVQIRIIGTVAVFKASQPRT